jgi:hypothetical protein
VRVIVDRLDGGNLLRNLRIDAAGRSSGTRCVDEEKDDCGAPAQEQNLAGGKACVLISIAGRDPCQSPVHLKASSVPKRASEY